MIYLGTTSRIIISSMLESKISPQKTGDRHRLLRWASRRSLTLEDLGIPGDTWEAGKVAEDWGKWPWK